MSNIPLTDAEVERLEDFIFSPAASENALDYLGIHGLLTAIAISPTNVPQSEWMEAIFDGHPSYESPEQQHAIESLLTRELTTIINELNTDDVLELPCELDPNDDQGSLSAWCQGFMEGVFLREEQWFEQNESDVAEMLLPMMMASELFDEEEFAELLQNPKLTQQLCEDIPNLLTDLYLLFRVPEAEKKPASKPRKT